jgi:hypothetical protein
MLGNHLQSLISPTLDYFQVRRIYFQERLIGAKERSGQGFHVIFSNRINAEDGCFYVSAGYFMLPVVALANMLKGVQESDPSLSKKRQTFFTTDGHG